MLADNTRRLLRLDLLVISNARLAARLVGANRNQELADALFGHQVPGQ